MITLTKEQKREKRKQRARDYYANNKHRWKGAYEKIHPLYNIWQSIKKRQRNFIKGKDEMYKKLNIKMYPPWYNSSKEFYKYVEEELGPRPSPQHSIDRFPNIFGNYEPGNIRWASPKEQNNNKRSNRKHKDSIREDEIIWYQNRFMTLSEFSQIVGIHLKAVKYRYAFFHEADYILNWKWDNRLYEWENRYYSMVELHLISGIKFQRLYERIVKLGWSVDRAMIE